MAMVVDTTSLSGDFYREGDNVTRGVALDPTMTMSADATAEGKSPASVDQGKNDKMEETAKKIESIMVEAPKFAGTTPKPCEAILVADRIDSTKAPQRRRGGNRTRTTQSAPTAAELADLLLASELVPTATKKAAVETSSLPTTTPSSAEPSPLLTVLPNPGPEDAWPSLRESVCGWDFCSEASDDELEEALLPPPAQKLEEAEAVEEWCLVSKGRKQPAVVEQAPTAVDAQQPSFADMVKGRSSSKQVLPPVSGTRLSPLRPRSPRRAPTPVEEDEDDTMDIMPFQNGKGRGWTKQHKASWSTKLQRKVAEKSASRAVQSFHSRGWIQDHE